MNRRTLATGALAAAPLALVSAMTEAAPERFVADDEVVFRVTRFLVRNNELLVPGGQVIVPDGKVEFVKYTLQTAYPQYGSIDEAKSFAHMPRNDQRRLGDVLLELSGWLSSVKLREYNGEILLYWSGTVD